MEGTALAIAIARMIEEIANEAPEVIQHFVDGNAGKYDWKSIRMRSTEELRQEVDEQSNP